MSLNKVEQVVNVTRTRGRIHYLRSNSANFTKSIVLVLFALPVVISQVGDYTSLKYNYLSR